MRLPAKLYWSEERRNWRYECSGFYPFRLPCYMSNTICGRWAENKINLKGKLSGDLHCPDHVSHEVPTGSLVINRYVLGYLWCTFSMYTGKAPDVHAKGVHRIKCPTEAKSVFFWLPFGRYMSVYCKEKYGIAQFHTTSSNQKCIPLPGLSIHKEWENGPSGLFRQGKADGQSSP